MKFNITKFKWLQLGNNQEIKLEYNYMSDNYNFPITPADEVRDLGVIMNEFCDYQSHINYICKKVRKRIGYILRTFINREPHFLKFIWRTYIGPIIDYCSQLYAPVNGTQLLKLENLLKSYTKRAEGLSNMHYWDRLKAMKMTSIGRRFERYKILYSWKVITGKTDNCGLNFTYNQNIGHTIETCNVQKFAQTKRTQSFQYVGPRLFNTLPRYLRDKLDVSLDTWKSELDNLLERIPDNPHTPDTIPGLCDHYTAGPTNSLIYWLPFLGLNDRRSTQTVSKS